MKKKPWKIVEGIKTHFWSHKEFGCIVESQRKESETGWQNEKCWSRSSWRAKEQKWKTIRRLNNVWSFSSGYDSATFIFFMSQRITDVIKVIFIKSCGGLLLWNICLIHLKDLIPDSVKIFVISQNNLTWIRQNSEIWPAGLVLLISLEFMNFEY